MKEKTLPQKNYMIVADDAIFSRRVPLLFKLKEKNRRDRLAVPVFYEGDNI